MELKNIVYLSAGHALLGVATSFAVMAYGINANVTGLPLMAWRVAYYVWRVAWGPSIFIVSKLPNLWAIAIAWIILSIAWATIIITFFGFIKRITQRIADGRLKKDL